MPVAACTGLDLGTKKEGQSSRLLRQPAALAHEREKGEKRPRVATEAETVE
jgi:hypothetical protein